MIPGICRVCGCTDLEACPGGCVWADSTATLCSSCIETEAELERLVELAHRTGEAQAPAELDPFVQSLTTPSHWDTRRRIILPDEPLDPWND